DDHGPAGPARAEDAAVDGEGLALGAAGIDRARVDDDAVAPGERGGLREQRLARPPVGRREAVGGRWRHVVPRAAQITSIARPSRPAMPCSRVRQRCPGTMGWASTRVPVLTMSPGA